ncbi:MAG: hypothetical protein JWP01_2907 [Myxococcales bacterium]|nr:hypothetical protein [Myxococcales bacterium]
MPSLATVSYLLAGMLAGRNSQRIPSSSCRDCRHEVADACRDRRTHGATSTRQGRVGNSRKRPPLRNSAKRHRRQGKFGAPSVTANEMGGAQSSYPLEALEVIATVSHQPFVATTFTARYGTLGSDTSISPHEPVVDEGKEYVLLIVSRGQTELTMLSRRQLITVESGSVRDEDSHQVLAWAEFVMRLDELGADVGAAQ